MLQQVPAWQRPLLKVVMSLYRLAYEHALRRMDVIVCNSETVRRRIKRFLGNDSVVIYPPCETERFRWINQDNYYLSTARLDSMKRVDLIVKAFDKMPNKRLLVVSEGVDMSKIKRIAEKALNIEVLGRVGEEHLSDLIGRCIATIYIPKDEDFGMSPVESMAAGKPVIGVREGGLLESVISGETGLLVRPEPVAEDIIEAVQQMDAQTALSMRGACEAQARRFDKGVFLEKMKEILLS